MKDQTTLYWDYSVTELPETLGGGLELTVHFYHQKTKPDLFEVSFDKKELKQYGFDLLQYAEDIRGHDLSHLKDIEDMDEYDAAIFDYLNSIGKIEEYFCDMINSDCPDLDEYEIFEGIYEKACEHAERNGIQN